MKKFIFAMFLLSTLVFFTQGNVFADEIYQDENGVWTNRPRDGAVDAVKSGGKGVGESVRDATEAGLLGLTHMLAAPGQKALEDFAKRSAREMGSSAYKASRDSSVTKAYTDFWRGVGDEYVAELKCKNQGICPRIMAGENLEEYERFDSSTAGEVKSEWEFFEDPR